MKISNDKEEPLLPRDAHSNSPIETEVNEAKEKANKEAKTRVPLAPSVNNDLDVSIPPLSLTSESLIDFSEDQFRFSSKAQAFLTNTQLTPADLNDAKINHEIFEQLLNSGFTKRLLRWVALENLIQKSFLFPLLDERGIQNTESHSKNPKCWPATIEWFSSRTWPKGQSLPFKSETMIRRAYAMDDFFDGVESIITRGWATLLATFLANDFYNYYSYPDERYGTTPASILFSQGENEKTLITYLSRPEHWYGFLVFFGIPLSWGLIKALRTNLCCPPTLDAKKFTALQTFFKNYEEGNFCYELYNWLIPFSNARNILDATRQILLWNNQINFEQRLELYQSFQSFSLRLKNIAQFYSLYLLCDIADGIATSDIVRLSKLKVESEVLKSLLANKAYALQELQIFVKHYPLEPQHNSCCARYLKPLPHYLVAHYLLWCLGQPKSTLLQPLFWGFKGFKLLVKANFAYLMYQGITAALQLYYRKRACEEDGKNWRFINEIGDYNCTVCADFPIPYPYTFTMQSCLDDFLRVPRDTSETIRLLERVQNSDKITELNLSNQRFPDINGTNNLTLIMPVIQRRISTLNNFVYNSVFSLDDFKLGTLGVKAIASFLPKANLQLLDLSGTVAYNATIFLASSLANSKLRTLYLAYNNIEDNGAIALGTALQNSLLQSLALGNNHIGDTGAAALGIGITHSKLQALFLDDNNIGDSGAAAIGSGLSNSTLQTLDLSNNDINISGAVSLGANLPNSNLLYLNLYNNSIQASGTRALVAGLPKSIIQTLLLGNNNIGDSGAIAVGANLPSSKLLTLDLGGNNIGERGATAIGAGLANSTVQALYLAYNNIEDNGAAALAIGLANSTLQGLYLYNNNIQDRGATAISVSLPNTILQILDFSSNKVGDSGTAALAARLSYSTLQTLFLSGNNITSGGAIALGAGLPNSTLQILDLSDNKVGDDGVSSLGIGLSNSKLQSLILNNNQIRENGAMALGAGLPNSSLKILGLNGNRIGHRGAAAIGAGLHKSSLQELYLIGNNISNSGAMALSTGLPNSTLQILYLHNNNIQDSGAVAIGEKLQNSTLQVLTLINNHIGDGGAIALGEGLPKSKLQHLILTDNDIGDSGAQAIADNLIMLPKKPQHRLWINLLDPNDRPIQEQPKSNNQLTELKLSYNHINNSGVEALCKALPWTSIPVSSLILDANNIDQAIVQNGICVTSNSFSLKAPLPLRLWYQSAQLILQPIHFTYRQLNNWLNLGHDLKTRRDNINLKQFTKQNPFETNFDMDGRLTVSQCLINNTEVSLTLTQLEYSFPSSSLKFPSLNLPSLSNSKFKSNVDSKIQSTMPSSYSDNTSLLMLIIPLIALYYFLLRFFPSYFQDVALNVQTSQSKKSKMKQLAGTITQQKSIIPKTKITIHQADIPIPSGNINMLPQYTNIMCKPTVLKVNTDQGVKGTKDNREIANKKILYL